MAKLSDETALILAIDQGTTSSRAIVFDSRANIICTEQAEFPQYFPDNAWVEHDPEDIWKTSLCCAQRALAYAESSVTGGKVTAIGISNQRETTLIWNKKTGEPIYRAIVWQDRRTAKYCNELKRQGFEPMVAERTGLRLDPYFSASKITWLLDTIPGARERAENGELCFGTVDTFLLYRLSGGQAHKTDATNASRTALYNIHTGEWDDELLKLFNIPRALLPEVCDTAADFALTEPSLFSRAIPVCAMVGDQQAAAFGQCCFETGDAKSTYGTGAFVLLNTGDKVIQSQHQLLSTVAVQLNGRRQYALEGSIFVAGSAIQWLRDGLGIIDNAEQTESYARDLRSNDGVYLVPAFTGIGAPYWDADARGALYGITRSTGPAHIARASLESVAYQTFDLLEAMSADAGALSSLKIDGGMLANTWFVEFLANIVDLKLERPVCNESSALGAAYLAGLQAGIFQNQDQLRQLHQCSARIIPHMTDVNRQSLLADWHRAVKRTLM
ncbi:MAG: glycerol kinase [Flavobacteriales bacterium]|jgi:glycerol kinase